MAMTASLLIKARDQASSVFGRIAARAKSMGNAFKPVTRAARDTDRAIGGIGTGVISRFARIGAAARRTVSDMRLLERGAYGVGRGLG